MKGLVRDWPFIDIAAKSPQHAADYVKKYDHGQPVLVFQGPPEIKGRFIYNDDLRSLNFERRQAPLSPTIDFLLSLLDHNNPPSCYAGSVEMKGSLAEILKQNPKPLLHDVNDMLIGLWVGNRTRIAAHWDLPQNVACVVRGKRRFTLFPPDQLKNLYIGPIDFTLAGQPCSLVDFHAPDFERFPNFQEALHHAKIADLEPGDAVYVPSMWFHNVEAFDDFSLQVNYFWRDGPSYMVTPLFTLLHGLLTLRDLPKVERDAWRHFFDHYIFETNGDPTSHMPEAGKGVLGPMTPEKVAQLRQFLAQHLMR